MGFSTTGTGRTDWLRSEVEIGDEQRRRDLGADAADSDHLLDPKH